jgi:hypothetical protein
MTYNKSKVKGSTFERDATELLNAMIRKSRFVRVPSSGAMGTIMSEPLLMSDIKGKIDSIDKPFRIEAKAGYNSSKDKEVKQFTLKKEWLDKVKIEADCSYSIPMLIGKFSGARSGTKVFVAMDIETFCEIINRTTELYEEVEAYEREKMAGS